MGERTQLYVHYKKEDKERVLGYHHQWLYDVFAIIRVYQFLKFVKGNLEASEFSAFRNTKWTYRRGEADAIAKALFSFSLKKDDYNPCGNLIDNYLEYVDDGYEKLTEDQKEEARLLAEPKINPFEGDSDHGFIVFDIDAPDVGKDKNKNNFKIKFAFCKFKGWCQIETMNAAEWHRREKYHRLTSSDKRMIEWIDSNFEVMTPEEVFECFGPLKGMCVDLDKLEPVPDISFKDKSFKEIVSKLKRPYIQLSKDEYEKVKAVGTDVVKYKDRLYTFGNYDGDRLGLMRYYED